MTKSNRVAINPNQKGGDKGSLRRGAGTPGAGDRFLFTIGRPTQDL